MANKRKETARPATQTSKADVCPACGIKLENTAGDMLHPCKEGCDFSGWAANPKQWTTIRHGIEAEATMIESSDEGTCFSWRDIATVLIGECRLLIKGCHDHGLWVYRCQKCLALYVNGCGEKLICECGSKEREEVLP